MTNHEVDIMFAETGSLLADLLDGMDRGVLTFAGQDDDWHSGLVRALTGRPDVEEWCRAVLVAMDERLAAEPSLAPGLALTEPRPRHWLDEGADGHETPWRAEPSVCLVGTALSQMAAAAALGRCGLGPSRGIDIVGGHSSGVVTAWLWARHGTEPPVEAAVDALVVLAVVGDVGGAHPWAGREPRTSDSGSMLAVRGLTEPALAELLTDVTDLTDERAAGGIAVALQNAWDRFVLCGPPGRLAVWRERVADHPSVGTEWLSSVAPYHHEALRPGLADALRRLRAAGIRLDGTLRVPLVDPADGSRVTDGDVLGQLVESMLVRPVRWADTLVSVVGATSSTGPRRAPVVLDAGPSVAVARMSERALRGLGVGVLALGDGEAAARCREVAADRLRDRERRRRRALLGEDPAFRRRTPA